MSDKICLFLIFSCLLVGSSAQTTGKGKVQFRNCPEDVYIKVASIGAIDDQVPWIDCDEEEPYFSGSLWKNSSGDYSITKRTKTVWYNQEMLGGAEYFWFHGACAGDEICIDNAITDHVAPGGARMIVRNVDVCWSQNGVWMDFCSQCQDCNNQATLPRGRWWKYDRTFMANELGAYTSPSMALEMHLEYQMLADCSWHVDYGCEEGELK
jgi:hypothetical protein